MPREKDEVSANPHKMTRIEIIGKIINGKQVFFIVDCDKSFCDVCGKEACTLEYFFEKSPERAKIFVNEVYNFVTGKNPELKTMFTEKKDVITYILKKCSGYDNFYDFLFKGNKLVSIKYDDFINLKKNEQF